MTRVEYPYQSGRPIIPVFVGVNQPLIFSLANAGRSIPPAREGHFLVDTGAEDTFIDVSILNFLKIHPTNQVPVLVGATGGQAVAFDQYDVKLRVKAKTQGQRDFELGAIPVLGGDFSSTNIDGLIGRDFLNYCDAYFHGGAQKFSVLFR